MVITTLFNIRYNEIREKTTPVEFELIKDEIDGIDEMISNGQENYNWNSEGITMRIVYCIMIKNN